MLVSTPVIASHLVNMKRLLLPIVGTYTIGARERRFFRSQASNVRLHSISKTKKETNESQDDVARRYQTEGRKTI